MWFHGLHLLRLLALFSATSILRAGLLQTRKARIVVELHLEGKPYTMELDTGASLTIVSEMFFGKIIIARDHESGGFLSRYGEWTKAIQS
jgi:hypothetical protein